MITTKSVKWINAPISSLVDINPPNDLSLINDSTEVSFIPMEYVGEDGRIINKDIRRYGDVKTGYTCFTDGDILFAKITPCMENGKGAVVDNLINGIGCGSTEFHILRPKSNDDTEYIFHITRWKDFRIQATRFFTGSAGQQRVSKALFSKLKIPIAPENSRRNIATVLSTLDDAILTTKSIITQTEELKRGLMQQLLTRGIDENGRIRNEKTHKFKDSPVGRIPIEWDFCKCGEILNLKRGYDLPTKERVPGKIPVYSSAGVTGYHEIYKVKGPGIVTGRYGTIGDVFLVNEDFWPLNTTLYVTDIKGNDIVFLSYLLKSILEAYQNDAHSIPGINRNYVHRVLTIIPPKDEQIQIGILLTEIDNKIVFEGNFLKKLLQLKNRLTSDLLTGRVRVPSLR